MTTKRPPGKAAATKLPKLIERAVVAYTFDDGEVFKLKPADVIVSLIRQWARLADSDDPIARAAAMKRLHEVATAATEKALAPVGNAMGGNKAAKTKAKNTSASKLKAIRRFNVLIATGDRDATEAMAVMEGEGFSRATLYRHLKDDLKKLGRGRKAVKKIATRKDL